MMMTLPVYLPGQRVPAGDHMSRALHWKDHGGCLVVGCTNTAVDCDDHDRYRVTSANAAYETAKGKAIAYCWGRADAGDATAHPQDVWWAFSEWYGRAAFDFTLQTRSHLPSIQGAWDLFINDKEI